MTNEKQEEAGPVTVQIGVCGSCHALFMLSPTRETSPCHGADPLAVLATLAVAENGDVAGIWGQPPHQAALDITEEPAPAAAPLEEPPAEDAGALRSEEEIDNLEVLLEGIGGYLADGGLTDDDVGGWFERMGAEREAASTAVGRLHAVRELIRTLREPAEPVPVAPAPLEAESSPENT